MKLLTLCGSVLMLVMRLNNTPQQVEERMKPINRLYIIGTLYERSVILMDKIENIEARDNGNKSIWKLKDELKMVLEAIEFNEWLRRFV